MTEVSLTAGEIVDQDFILELPSCQLQGYLNKVMGRISLNSRQLLRLNPDEIISFTEYEVTYTSLDRTYLTRDDYYHLVEMVNDGSIIGMEIINETQWGTIETFYTYTSDDIQPGERDIDNEVETILAEFGHTPDHLVLRYSSLYFPI